MAVFYEKHRKELFVCIVLGILVAIGIYNVLTPYFTDDFSYYMEVQEAHSFWDLIRQQYGEYMSRNCRAISQFHVRMFISVDKWVFNLVNSLMFAAQILLIYALIRREKKYDCFVLMLSLIFVWRYSVLFGETNLWLCGSCNYLWPSVFMLGFLVWYRGRLRQGMTISHPVCTAIIGFLFGILAGWCNENTSGGIFIAWFWYTMMALLGWKESEETEALKDTLPKRIRRRLQPYMITSGAGICCGLLAMVLCPGIRGRVEMTEEAFTGMARYLSRLYKITVSWKELFGEVLVILVVAVVILVLQQKWKTWKEVVTDDIWIFLFMALAVSLVLILIPTQTERTYYGAGIFLFIACIRAICDCDKKEFLVAVLRYGLISVLCLWLFFTYFNNLINLWRIDRENTERTEYIVAGREENGKEASVVIPQYREEFRNRYSAAHDSDMTEDPGFWINIFYEWYYGVDSISAIPREEWNVQYGDEKE